MNRRQKSMNIIQISSNVKMVLRNEHVYMHTYEHVFSMYYLLIWANRFWTQNIQTTAKHGEKPHFSPWVSYLVPPADSWYDRSSCSVLILNARPSSSTFLLHIALSLLSFKYRFILFFDSGYFQWTLLITLSESDWISVRIHNIWTDKLKKISGD